MPNLKTIELTVHESGIHCASCERRIQITLEKLAGVQSVKADHRSQRVQLALDEEKVTLAQVLERLAFLGYDASPNR
jgi:copper chaperone CopZ